jgi:hypothetical protein
MRGIAARLTCLGCGLLLLAGCADDPLGRQAVSGTVQFQGRPLDQGRIQFVPLQKGPTESGATIENGAFQIPRESGLAPGTYKVSVFSYDQKGPKVPSEEVPGDPGNTQFKERIPKKYNAETALTVEVKKGGSNVFDLRLD